MIEHSMVVRSMVVKNTAIHIITKIRHVSIYENGQRLCYFNFTQTSYDTVQRIGCVRSGYCISLAIVGRLSRFAARAFGKN